MIFALVAVLCVHSRAARATSVIPISDAELSRRADLVVHGTVLASQVEEDALGRPVTVTLIRPLAILKGGLSGDLVLHQVGGTLPDGRFLKMWGRPEYSPGHEVVVFAIARPDGDYETAEMLLGKFEVSQDAAGHRFAIPDLAKGVHPGVDVFASEEDAALGISSDAARPAAGHRLASAAAATVADAVSARPLTAFLTAIRNGQFSSFRAAEPQGALTPVSHSEWIGQGKTTMWGNINNSLWRYNNNATAVWVLNGTTNIDGGGVAEATGALSAWTSEPNSSINYTPGASSSNVIYMNATSSSLGCGWATCLSGAGVIGCGGPNGGGQHSWRGETYATIVGGTVELRAACSLNGYSSVITQSVLEHELGHTLGLGHPDQNVSAHDTCRGNENAAIMYSVAQNRVSLGTDDVDAIRWLYGDGGSSCTGPVPPSVSAISPASGVTGGGTSIAISGAGFQVGATVTVGGTAATSVSVVNASTIYATTAAHAAGSVSLVVTNPDSQTGSRSFSYVAVLANGTDLDASGGTDIIWRNSASGINSIWLMNGTTAANVVPLMSVTDPAWKLVGAGDFNADGKNDLVWRNDSTGLNSLWLMNGTTVSSVISLAAVPDTNWKIVGVADFNADGKADIVWRNVVNGLNSVWLMNGTVTSSIAGLPTVPDQSWKIAGVGDLNGDGKPDIVWRSSVGLNAVWMMNGTTSMGVQGIPNQTDLNWVIAGVGDFNGDHRADLIWRNKLNGLNAFWTMNGSTVTAVVGLPTLSDVNWSIGAPH
ncbi:MAG: FG-GAP-like repeat-containing protein [Acidobacteriota bacterium]